MVRRIGLFVALLAVAASTFMGARAVPFAAAREAELCFGQVPTIVGTPGDQVVGTEGPDVVVTNGGDGAQTLGGDDLLCITGVSGGPSPNLSYGGFFTGEGSDRIDATSGEVPDETVVNPGPGSDEVLGGRHTLSNGVGVGIVVHAVGFAGDADTIRTGAGPDMVYADDQDVVDLGPGRDRLDLLLDGDSSGGVSFEGGAGRNALDLKVTKRDEHYSWKVDNHSGRILREGKSVAEIGGFQVFTVQARAPLKFVGSDTAEWFYAVSGSWNRYVQDEWPVVVRMRGGDDVVLSSKGALDSRYNGGEGTDWFVFSYQDFVIDREYFDLATGALRFNGPDLEVRARAANFENARWVPRDGGTTTVKGTDGPNSIVSNAGLGRYEWVQFYGKGGDDTLRGAGGDDVLIGGSGQDVADGGGGIDRCKAEVRTSCEPGLSEWLMPDFVGLH